MKFDMGILEEVIQMKNQGRPESEIISSLQQEGFSPRSISDALNQARIKNAVSNIENEDEMQPSIMNEFQEDYQVPQPQDVYTPNTRELNGQNTYSPQQNYPPDYYQQEVYDYPSANTDSDTIIEISEQVFLKNIKEIIKQVDKLNEFKTLSQSKLDDISERIKRIEMTIDKLQMAILEKVGSYGQNIEGIKKEMSMMQDSFGKIINPLADRTTKQTNTNISESATKIIPKKKNLGKSKLDDRF